MKILAIAETFFPEFPTGLARVAWDVCRALAKRGHDVHLLCPSFAQASGIDSIRVADVQVSRFAQPCVSSFDPRNPAIRIDHYRAAIEALGNPRTWDVVHCHGIYAVLAAAEATRSRVPLVQTVHSPAILEQLWNWTHEGIRGFVKMPALLTIRRLEAAALTAASVCHSLSMYTRACMERLYSNSRSMRWALIPHWADHAWLRTHSVSAARQMLGWEARSRVVLTVRQLRPRYGIESAIRGVVPLVSTGQCDLRIVGDGESRDGLERLAHDLGIANGVFFEGRLSDDELRLAYQAADVFLLPSRALECFGVIAQEAMAAGLPVVATCIGAIPEMLAPIMPQLLVPPGAEERMTDVLRGVLGHPGNAPTPDNIIEYVCSRYAEEAIMASYERMFTAIAA